MSNVIFVLALVMGCAVGAAIGELVRFYLTRSVPDLVSIKILDVLASCQREMVAMKMAQSGDITTTRLVAAHTSQPMPVWNPPNLPTYEPAPDSPEEQAEMAALESARPWEQQGP